LGPEPKERNEPANIAIAVKAIAELKSVEVDEVIAAVYANTRRLYGGLVNVEHRTSNVEC
jgi:TatD DNase family protein